MEPVKRQSTTRKKSSATEGVSTRPVSTAVSWVNTTRAPQQAGGGSKLTFSHRYLHILGSRSGPGTSNISVTWKFVAPTLGRDSALLSTLSLTTCPAQRPFPCSSKSGQTGLRGENFNPVVTFARCDLAEKDGLGYLDRTDLALGVFPTGQLSLKTAATGFSQERTCVRQGNTCQLFKSQKRKRLWAWAPVT